jgi:predicted nucleotidyltransferase
MVDKITNIKLRIINLYTSNYLASHHIRGMAKLIKKSHVTLLPHLKALKQDKILLPQTIGKNKTYSLNINNILTKEYMLLSEIVESIKFLEQTFIIKKISTDILSLNISGTLILFGSYAKQRFKEKSDIDLFYVGNIKPDQINRIKGFGKIYGKTINVKTASLKNFERGIRKKDPLILEIVKNHLILQNPGRFINALWRYYGEISQNF